MIPKKIHYCWFSGKKIPKEFETYIESWRKNCPDYEIIRWDETNYDISRNSYMNQAYKEKRWGFVPDYARFDIIYQEGGIYLDTDVELIRSLEPLLDNPCFFGFEDNHHINPGLGFGAERENPVIKVLRDMYEQMNFYNKDGSLNLTPSPEYVTEQLRELGIKMNNQFQKKSDITVYPRDYFGAKDYYTGEINKTENTYSIHHFSCSWMTREEKKQEERRKKLCTIYGQFLGNRMDGIYKRTAKIKKPYGKNRECIKERIIEHFLFSDQLSLKRLERLPDTEDAVKKSSNRIALLTPAIKSDNIGDSIIESACIAGLPVLKEHHVVKVSTHTHPSGKEIRQLKSADLVIVTGSNLLSGNVRHSQWKLPMDYSALKNLCLMGCGWSERGESDSFSREFYKKILNNGWIHSVRDHYTEKQLKESGVNGIIYTGCPTMWNLTDDHCKKISCEKSKSVVTALTSYQSDYELDSFQMQVLFDHYETVFFWPQGTKDEKYLNWILTESEKKRVVILERNIEKFKTLLQTEKPDYIGNRLHAGIFALNNYCRSIIIAIDNRALEIGKDTGLPVLQREKLKEQLESWIYEVNTISIHMPWENIKLWKQQFSEGKDE